MGAFGGDSIMKAGVLMKGLSSLHKGLKKSPSAFNSVRTQPDVDCELDSVFTDTKSAASLNLALTVFRPVTKYTCPIHRPQSL